MSLNKEIMEAIERDLPRQTSDALRIRLDQLDTLETELGNTKQALQKEVFAHETLQNNNRQYDDLAVRGEALRVLEDLSNKRTTELDHREALLKVKEECTALRVTDMRSIVQDVFKNRDIVHQYSISGNGNMYRNGMSENMSFNGEATDKQIIPK